MKSIAKIFLSSMLPFASWGSDELEKRKLPVNWQEDNVEIQIKGTHCSAPLSAERFMLGVLSDRGMGLGPYLGDHRSIIKKMGGGNILWAGEVRVRHGEILEGNETSGYLHSNGIKSNIQELVHNRYMPWSEDGATVHYFESDHKHLFPMPELKDSQNYRHDFRNKVIPLGLMGIVAMHKMEGEQELRDPLRFMSLKFDFGIFDLMDAMLPAFFDPRTNQGIRPAREYQIIGQEYAKGILDEMKGWLQGKFSITKERLQSLSADLGRLITFLSQEPKDGITIYLEDESKAI